MHRFRSRFFVWFTFLCVASCAKSDKPVAIRDASEPVKSASLADAYRSQVDRILDSALKHNDAYEKMHQLCDGIGHRISGSESLERAIRWAVESLKADGQENVHTEAVMVPKWVRGRESAQIIAPRAFDLHMLGLGMSVGTPPEGVTASVVCVCDEAEFEAAADSMSGKIVLFNNPMPKFDLAKGSCYGETVRFRGKGPSMAAKHGAVACLIRSVTAHSLRSPHTGATRYEEGVTQIPGAAVSTEDADMIARLLHDGEDVRVCLKMEARHEGEAPSANVVAELRGREKPDEVLVIGGHIDSWDVGHGAHDDGGGCVIAMEAINVLRKLDLRPRRTIRVVLWTNEENGLGGGRQYAADHANELRNHIGAIEADSGVFSPRGLGISCVDEERGQKAATQVAEFMPLLSRLGPVKAESGGGGADISPMRPAGVIQMGFEVDGSTYFDYHHTHADTLDKIDPKHLNECVAALATMSYVIADMPVRLGE
ncbi:MAG: M20/M25/M40 family metallo-hydrolase [Planctomycetes bacterium]|nr:M20/M25/M40 family metallo-hydrolase [Planctomycetota bacterium]